MEQEKNSHIYTEMKTFVKSLFRVPQPRSSYTQLTRQEQVIIFRLRTGHNRLNHHLHRLKIVRSPNCQCGEEDQTVKHILQDCDKLQMLRDDVWPTDMSLHKKLYGLWKSYSQQFVLSAGLDSSSNLGLSDISTHIIFPLSSVSKANEKKKKRLAVGP